ncbi:hypothetical protein KTI55_01695 [Acinetobacter ursingii]|uniref:hypothetical protein n=1 Tax=Acinetobacter ursingii TaxID=108980 RepID=UPI0021CD7DE3|nr:hypothetical protein [Acinetobacter ursingii]MCU4495287.1 hypothetical protein [Acinetobacter ursingii]
MTNCPNCNSSNTKTLHMVWMGGTRSGKSGFGGVGVSSSGRVSVGGGRGRSSSQSNLAAICAPPKKAISAKLIVGLLAVMFWLPLLLSLLNIGKSPNFLHGFFTVILVIPLLIIIGYGLIKLYKRLDAHNNKQINEYFDSWICLKCGCKYNARHTENIRKTTAELSSNLSRLMDDRDKAP